MIKQKNIRYTKLYVESCSKCPHCVHVSFFGADKEYHALYICEKTRETIIKWADGCPSGNGPNIDRRCQLPMAQAPSLGKR